MLTSKKPFREWVYHTIGALLALDTQYRPEDVHTKRKLSKVAESKSIAAEAQRRKEVFLEHMREFNASEAQWTKEEFLEHLRKQLPD